LVLAPPDHIAGAVKVPQSPVGDYPRTSGENRVHPRGKPCFRPISGTRSYRREASYGQLESQSGCA
jgi:hypothetical protein